jgi:hypothetical protein
MLMISTVKAPKEAPDMNTMMAMMDSAGIIAPPLRCEGVPGFVAECSACHYCTRNAAMAPCKTSATSMQLQCKLSG